MKQENYDNYPVKQYGRITPRDYQQAAIDAAIKHCQESSDPSVLDMSVGAGKTIVIGALAKHVSDKGGRVMMLTRQSIIVDQNSVDAWLCECKNSIYSAGLGKKSAVYPVVFGSEGTVYNSLMLDVGYINGQSDYPSDLENYACDLMLIDECHHYDWLNDECQYSKIIAEMYRRNPKMRVIGLTGTAYRSTTPIIGESDDYFWKKKLIDINTEYLTDRGFLTPVSFGFGHDDAQYDLSEFRASGEDGIKDFTKAQMEEMESKIIKSKSITENIINEVIEKAKDRNGVMICVTGKKHMKEVARFLPKGSYAMITDDTPEKKRNRELKEVYDGKKKYILQINALSTGFNCPILDTLVILRKYHSLTLLVQTVGRVLRLLKPEQMDRGLVKEDALVLDYTDTFAEMGELYHNPMLEGADLAKSKEDHNTITCPKCGEENGQHAVRCRGESGGERCDFFFKSRVCEDSFAFGKTTEGCGAENAPTARQCRICGNVLINPEDNLSNKHYTESSFIEVKRFQMIPCKNDGVLVIYTLANGDEAKVFHSPFSKNQIAKRIWGNEFVKHHAITPALKKKVRAARNAGEMCQLADELDTVAAITHRINGKGKSVIAKFINK